MHISRRTILAAPALLGCADGATGRGRVFHIAPNGDGDGRSWDTAASLLSLDDLIRDLEPGGEILIAADRGEYRPTAVDISAGGKEGQIVRVRGVNSTTGEPMLAVLRGNRGGGEAGDEGFRLLRGADRLHFSHFDFRDIGNGCFRVGGPISKLTIEDCAFENVYRFFENTAVGDERGASIREFALRRCQGSGVERGFSRIRYASRDGLIEDCLARGLANEGGAIPAGCALDDRAGRITYRRCVMEGFQQWRAGDYWNGDGFSDEEENRGIRYEACTARGSTDGGFDCKSRDVVLQGCIAEDNKRNFRLWSDSATLAGCTSRNPNFRGREVEDADSCHIWIGGERRPRIAISDLTIEDREATQIFEFEHDQADVEIRGVTIRTPALNWGASVSAGDGDVLIAVPD